MVVFMLMRWLHSFINAVEKWQSASDQKAFDRYLSRSQNMADLENRIIRWQTSSIERRQFLR